MELVHDLLDQALLDRNGVPMGRVDGVTLELRDGAPPRVAHALVGGTVLVERLHPRLARWAARVRRWWGDGAEPGPTRVPVAQLSRAGHAWRVDEIDGRDTPALAWELWLREHVVARVPGGGR